MRYEEIARSLGAVAPLAYFAVSMAVAALLASFVEPSYLISQEGISVAYSLPYLAFTIAFVAAVAYIIIKRYSRLVERLVNAYIAVVAYLSALSIEAFSGLSLPLPLGLALAALPVLPAILSIRWRALRSLFYTVAAVLVAVLLAVAIPFSWVPVLLLAFAAYDAFAVFKGPLSAIPSGFSLMLIDLRSIKIGMGDVAFYSFVVSSLEVYRGWGYSLAGAALVLAGAAATLLLLSKFRRPLPGLTIPLALSLMAFILRL